MIFFTEPTCQCDPHEHDDETSPINYTAAISITGTLAKNVLEHKRRKELTQKIQQLQ